VFEMYKIHQDATYLPVFLEDEGYEMEGKKLPLVSASASMDDAGRIHVSLCNLHHEKEAELAMEIRGVEMKGKTSGRILTAPKMDSHNDFKNPDAVKPAAFDGAHSAKGSLAVKLPARSVVVLELS
jgi:alpha-N-arabinofuranosidase